MKGILVLLRCVVLSFVVSFVSHAEQNRNSPVQSYSRDAQGVTLYSHDGTTRIAVCSDRIIHVIASPTTEIPNPVVPIVNATWKPVSFDVREDAAAIHIETQAIRVDVARSTGAIAFLDRMGKTLLAEPESGGKSFDPVQILGVKSWRVAQDFISPRDEGIYGLGQHQEGWFNLRGVPLRLEQANTNISIPFLLSTRGFGLLWNNASVTDYDAADHPITLDPVTGEGHFRTTVGGNYGFLLSSDATEQLSLKVNDQTVLDLHNMWVPYSAGGKVSLQAATDYTVVAKGGKNGIRLSYRPPSDNMQFRSEAGNAVDYYFFYGGQPDKVISLYREATGQAPLFPRWAYGFWQCRERYSSQKQVLEVAAEFRRRGIPVDAFVQDWQYWGKYGWNALRFDETDYPDPSSMMRTLHQENLHLVISVWPKFGTDTEVDKELRRQVAMIPGQSGANEEWLDAFHPKAQTLFWQAMDQSLFKAGIDGWWLDASEPEGDPLKDVQTFLGPGNLVRNAYPLYEIGAVYNGQRSTSEEKRVVILTRSSFAGQQRNAAASWSGDISGNWETLRRQIPAGLNFSMSGIPYWTTDIGGFFRPDDQYTSAPYHELLVRWFEYGAFCPIFRIHGYKTETEMWKFGPQVEEILHAYDNLRYRLLPYIYSTAWSVTDQGQSMMRSLPLEFPSDLKARDVPDEFLFGPSLLINPVTQAGATTRSVYLPGGFNWVDFWSGKKSEGGQTIVAEAPIDQMPIYVKEGTIVPFGPVVQSAADKSDPVDLRIYGGKDADFTLYEDQGDSYAYENGQRSTIQIHWDEAHHELAIGNRKGTFPGMLQQHTFRIFCVSDKHAVGIASDVPPDTVIHYSGEQTRARVPLQ